MLERIELSEALKLLDENVKQVAKKEMVGLLDALGRISAQDVFSINDNPPFDRSPLDGYALMAEDSIGASKENPVALKVVGTIYAGDAWDSHLEKNQAVRIMTGAMLPKGANCVIRQEDSDYGSERVQIYNELRAFQNYCYQGEDFKKGTKLIETGEKLNFVHLGLLAGMGVPSIQVYAKPRVAVLATGDELTPPGAKLLPGKIYNSNLFIIAARLKELSINPVYLQQSEDDVEIVSQKLKQALAVADFVITTGGVSVGEKDIIHEVLAEIGADRKFWKVNLKPGTPATFSLCEQKPILSLSGNPFAALVTFELLARPILAKLTLDAELLTKEITAIIDTDFPKKSRQKRFIRGIFKDGKVKLPEGHASGMFGSMKNCNCLVQIGGDEKKTQKGDQVSVTLV